MACYLGYCISCNHLHSTVDSEYINDYFIKHSDKSHKGQRRYTIIPITQQEYRDYLAHRDNPKFWEAWNNKAKL